MAKLILIDQFHVTVYATRGLPEVEYLGICQRLDDPNFQAAVRKAVRVVARRFSGLSKARFSLTR